MGDYCEKGKKWREIQFPMCILPLQNVKWLHISYDVCMFISYDVSILLVLAHQVLLNFIVISNMKGFVMLGLCFETDFFCHTPH